MNKAYIRNAFDGKKYNLLKLFDLTNQRKTHKVETTELIWNLPYFHIFPERVKEANTNTPLLVHDDSKYGLVVIDGAHRLTKGLEEHMKYLNVFILNDQDLKAAEVN